MFTRTIVARLNGISTESRFREKFYCPRAGPRITGDNAEHAVKQPRHQGRRRLVEQVRGGDQCERREVIASNSGGAVRVEHLGPVPQPQHKFAALSRDPYPQYDVLTYYRIQLSRFPILRF